MGFASFSTTGAIKGVSIKDTNTQALTLSGGISFASLTSADNQSITILENNSSQTLIANSLVLSAVGQTSGTLYGISTLGNLNAGKSSGGNGGIKFSNLSNTNTNGKVTLLHIKQNANASIQGDFIVDTSSSTPSTSPITLIENEGKLDFRGRIYVGNNTSGALDYGGAFISSNTNAVINIKNDASFTFDCGNTEHKSSGFSAYPTTPNQDVSIQINLLEGKSLTLNAINGQKYTEDRSEKQDGSDMVHVQEGDIFLFSHPIDINNTQYNAGVKLHLANESKVYFDANPQQLWVLSGENALISIAGTPNQDGQVARHLITTRDWGTFLDSRYLDIYDFQIKNSDFILYADKGYMGVTNLPAGTLVTAASDSLFIMGSSTASSTTPIDNTLHLMIGNLKGNESKRAYAILAQVTAQNKDHISFNGLKKSGDSTYTKIYSGFDTAEVKLTRTRTTVGGDEIDYYWSDLIPEGYQIDESTITPTASAISTNFFALNAIFNNLNKRMGELRASEYSQGLWGRIIGGEQRSDFGVTAYTDYATAQFGYDYGFKLENATNYLGVALGYTYAKTTQDSQNYIADTFGSTLSGSNLTNTHSFDLTLYNAYVSEDGFYSDSLLKVGYLHSLLDMVGQTQTYENDNLALILSEEFGYRFKLGEKREWIIEPQLEVSYAFLNDSTFTQFKGAYSLSSTQDSISMLRARIGASWGYDFKNFFTDSAKNAYLYLGTSYEFDYISGGDVHYQTSGGNTQIYNPFESNGRFVLNIGTNILFNDWARMYVDIEKDFGSKLQKEYQINVGARFSIGEKPQEHKNEDLNQPQTEIQK